MRLLLNPKFFTLPIALFILINCEITGQIFSSSVVLGEVYTTGSVRFETPPTRINLKIVSPNGNASYAFGVTNFNEVTSTNPYSILFTNNGSNNSVLIYVDKSTTDDDYVDIYSRCITTADIVWTSNYIIGQIQFSAAQKVAADVNIDRIISVADIVSTQRVILGYDDEKFQNSIVIDGITHTNISAVYPTADDLEALNGNVFNVPYTCVYAYKPLLGSLIGRNFAAIRLGDTNESCANFFTDN